MQVMDTYLLPSISPDQGTKNQLILGCLISSQDKPKLGVYVLFWTSLSNLGHHWVKQYIKHQL